MFVGCAPAILRPLSVLSALRPQDVFATSLYTGTGVARSVTSGVDLTTAGGLVWTKDRTAANSHGLFDTLRGITRSLTSNNTAAEANNAELTAVGATGFTTGGNPGDTRLANFNGDNYAAWSFKRAPKFFDIVTYTGDGTGARTLNHILGIAPGFATAKARSTAGDWVVGMPILTNGRLLLNTTDARVAGALITNYTDTTVTVASSYNQTNVTYVLLLFAHNPDTTNGIVQCGSFTDGGNGSTNTITLGWLPQFIIAKYSTASSSWFMLDISRGWAAGNDALLAAQVSSAEGVGSDLGQPTSNGFVWNGQASATVIYMAIRAPIT
jgi:hypothetical protein